MAGKGEGSGFAARLAAAHRVARTSGPAEAAEAKAPRARATSPGAAPVRPAAKRKRRAVARRAD